MYIYLIANINNKRKNIYTYTCIDGSYVKVLQNT